MTYLVAGDWHLSPQSPELHARLALAFLDRARAEGATAVLNGDVFDDLFAGRRAREAHPAVAGAIASLAAEGRLRRARGNHDPGEGEERIVLDVPELGRVLVEHGDAVDPIHASAIGRLGDAVSRILGRLAVVRGAARMADAAARTLAGDRMVAIFRRRCLAVVERGGFAFGVFGHLHVPHLVAGDRYVNAGGILDDGLTYVALERTGPRLLWIRPADLSARDGGNEGEMR